ncbi:hypothetical protein G647_03585 [Cladophialophora carrionii CBS 160.54]|uniref:BZIP domain-containing protein n=1 Tax=Cladophialophora carrionii CBS 160.54 TaxID=1279043 RepID=V9DBY2_9EURO|nr:uncharacterized protein G647_03585 [Cladophialophora carrionii CBS 160.54]ETI24216.1 hypothetical protein G647_03585 [Cladophialophora carrionii CBS 160.54]
MSNKPSPNWLSKLRRSPSEYHSIPFKIHESRDRRIDAEPSFPMQHELDSLISDSLILFPPSTNLHPTGICLPATEHPDGRTTYPRATETTQSSEGGGDVDNDAKARRREQVRRAQRRPSLNTNAAWANYLITSTNRTHRDRKATYVKTLEAEVAKLRARDSAHEAELLAYRMTIRRLKELIKYHKIPLPQDLASDPNFQSPQATIELLGFPNHQTIRAQMPPPESYFLGGSSSPLQQQQQVNNNILSSSADLSYTNNPLQSAGSTTSSSDLFSGLTISEAPTSLHAPSIYSQTASSAPPAPPISTTMPHPQGLGATQVGVDFVLALEHVCLEHHTEHANADDGSGHGMMLMSPIMWHSPAPQATGRTTTRRQQQQQQQQQPSPAATRLTAQAPPPAQTSSGLPSGTRWSVPAIELEKLLDFSDRLSLEGEITPVEAWQRIRQHPNFDGLTRDGLETLKQTLLPEVTCYG